MKTIEEMSLNELLIKKRIIFLNGEITQELANNIILKLLYLESLDSKKDICIYINTPGGNTDAMNAIRDVMECIEPDVSVLNISCAYSAGSLILASGAKGKRYSLKSAKVLIHQVSVATGKTVWKGDELIDTAKDIINTKVDYIDAMVEKTNISKEQIEEFMKKDTYLSAIQALKLGIIDQILG